MDTLNSLRQTEREMRSSAGGLYIHVAYCRNKCIYCDFYSAGERIAEWQRYVDALEHEYDQRRSELPYPLRTVYIGGGTPSLMPMRDFIKLTDVIRPDMGDTVEFTIEVNPEDVSETNLEIWKNCGVNRLSIGIQSLQDILLKKIRRRHDAETSLRAYNMARKYFDNISIDLMFGIPGQTLEMWKDDIRQIINLRPQHVSAYSLMYEPGTALTKLRELGKISEADDALTMEMFEFLTAQLRKAGYEHYEISNYALPGYQSRHNSSYWTQNSYLGIGPGAHSYDGKNIRKANLPDIRRYLDFWANDTLHAKCSGNTVDAPCQTEILTDIEMLEEYIMTRLRTCDGIEKELFISKFGNEEWESLKSRSNGHISDGSVVLEQNHLYIAESAILTSDSIIVDLLPEGH